MSTDEYENVFLTPRTMAIEEELKKMRIQQPLSSSDSRTPPAKYKALFATA